MTGSHHAVSIPPKREVTGRLIRTHLVQSQFGFCFLHAGSRAACLFEVALMSKPRPQGTASAIQIAETIVKVQGNIFIKELLREKKRADSTIRIGVTKEEILSNLVEAIKQGKISRQDLDAWVQEVEGWGKQHIYPYRAAADLADAPFWKSADALKHRLKKTILASAWTETTRLTFPQELALASVNYKDARFEVIWHERFEHWNRDKARDPGREVIDGDLYEFRAYRQELARSVMRFVLIPSERAALFLQIPLADPEHEIARGKARDTLREVFPWNQLTPVNISRAIKELDQAELNMGDHGQVRAQNTKFAASGATVEFDADPGNQVWKNVPAVRSVRRALESKSFTGDSGKFRVRLDSGEGMNREVIMSLNGKGKRVYLHSGMTADEAWIVLNQVIKHGA